MDSAFAKKQLQKYGWAEGQGLGRSEDGILEPLRVSLKRDKAGVGAHPGKEFSTHWWSSLFDHAASKITVHNTESSNTSSSPAQTPGCLCLCQLASDLIDLMSTSDQQLDHGVEISSTSVEESASQLKRRHYGENRDSLLYGGFTQSSCVHQDGRECRTTEEMSDDSVPTSRLLSDEELLKACSGRTAHKAARHGFRLSGKLKRIKEQEQGLDMASELCCHKSARKCQPRARKRRLDRDNICAMDERKMKIQHTSDAKTAVESCTLTAKTKSIM